MQIQKKSLPLQPQLRKTTVLKLMKIARKSEKIAKNKVFSKKLQKSSFKIWWLGKFALPLHHFRVRNMTSERFENGSLIYWLY